MPTMSEDHFAEVLQVLKSKDQSGQFYGGWKFSCILVHFNPLQFAQEDTDTLLAM
jgi:hypothetical protein